jgi:hypothetical protein
MPVSTQLGAPPAPVEETLLVALLAIPPAPPAPLLLEAPPADEVEELLLDTAEPLDAATVLAPV